MTCSLVDAIDEVLDYIGEMSRTGGPGPSDAAIKRLSREAARLRKTRARQKAWRFIRKHPETVFTANV
jgi:hypothetical protein